MRTLLKTIKEGNHTLLLVLSLVFLFYAANNFYVLRVDNAPLVTDEAMFFSKSWYYLQNPLRFASISRQYSRDHPPLHMMLSVPFYTLFGYAPDVAILSTLLAGFVLIVSVFVIGRELHNDWAGVFAAALTILLPGIFGFSRTYLQEFTLTAAVTLSVALLLLSRKFSRPEFTLAFGLSVGMGLLVKWNFTAFVIGPFLFCAIAAGREIAESDNWRSEMIRRCGTLIVAVIIGLLLCSWWYLPNLNSILAHMGRVMAEQDVANPLFSFQNIFYYMRLLWSFQLSPILALASALSAIYLGMKKDSRLLFLFSWILIPYVVMTFLFVTNKGAKFTIPYLPAFSLLFSFAIFLLKKRLKWLVMSVLILLSLFQFVSLTYFTSPVHPHLKIQKGLLSPDRRDWHLSELSESMNSALEDESNPYVFIIPKTIYSGDTIQALQGEGELDSFDYYDGSSCVEGLWECGKSSGFYGDEIGRSQMVLVGAEPSLPDDSVQQTEYEAIIEAWQREEEDFSLVRSFEEPARIQLYIRKDVQAISD